MRNPWRLLYCSIPFLALAAPLKAAPLDPFALSDAVLIDFTFTLPADVTVKYFGGDEVVCLTLGDADCDFKVDQVNFGTMPKPPDYLYSIRHEYAVEASAPPPRFSTAFFELTSFFHFFSSRDDDLFLPINWTVTYNLETEGVSSKASIALFYATMGPDGQGVPDTLLFPPVTITNGAPPDAAAELNETLTLQLFPGETTLRIEDPVIADVVVSEPAAWPLLLSGLAPLLPFGRLRRPVQTA